MDSILRVEESAKESRVEVHNSEDVMYKYLSFSPEGNSTDVSLRVRQPDCKLYNLRSSGTRDEVRGISTSSPCLCSSTGKN
jgi:hypothetical protein